MSLSLRLAAARGIFGRTFALRGNGAEAPVRTRRIGTVSVWRLAVENKNKPTEGREAWVKRLTRHWQGHPSAVPRSGKSDEGGMVRMWTDSDRAGDTDPRRSCGGGWKKYRNKLERAIGVSRRRSGVEPSASQREPWFHSHARNRMEAPPELEISADARAWQGKVTQDRGQHMIRKQRARALPWQVVAPLLLHDGDGCSGVTQFCCLGGALSSGVSG